MNDERFFKLVDKKTFDEETDKLAEETQARCGLVLIKCLTMNHEAMTELNDGPTEDMSDFCHRFEQEVAVKIVKIGMENGIEAREAVEKSRRYGKYDK